MTLADSFGSILADARRGRPPALGRIYRALAPAVLGYLRGQGAREPEDLTSDVFVGVVRGLPRFRGDERAFRSWVFSIAHRRLMDERRRLFRRREDAVAPEEMATTLADRMVGDTEDEALANLGSQGALRLLEGLTPEQRGVLLLRVVADLSVEETALVLEKTPGAVKALQRRALSSLVRHLEREGVS